MDLKYRLITLPSPKLCLGEGMWVQDIHQLWPSTLACLKQVAAYGCMVCISALHSNDIASASIHRTRIKKLGVAADITSAASKRLKQASLIYTEVAHLSYKSIYARVRSWYQLRSLRSQLCSYIYISKSVPAAVPASESNHLGCC